MVLRQSGGGRPADDTDLMSRPFILAHLSDVHLAPLPPFALRHWNVKRVLGYLNWRRGRGSVHARDALDRITADVAAQSPDHIAVTGDLVNIALPGEYIAARAWLDALGPPTGVSVVPGNHDIYTHLRGDPGCDRWAPFMRGDADAAAPADQPPTFPYLRVRGRVALIGVNSAEPTPPFVAAGRVGEPQMGEIATLLAELAAQGLFRVVMIHHPPLPGLAPPSRGLKDAAAFERVLLRHGAELVLHGHNHRDMLSWRAWRGGRFPVLGIASGSAIRPHHGEPTARYNLIEIAARDGGIVMRVRSRGLDPAGRQVVDLPGAPLGAGVVASYHLT